MRDEEARNPRHADGILGSGTKEMQQNDKTNNAYNARIRFARATARAASSNAHPVRASQSVVGRDRRGRVAKNTTPQHAPQRVVAARRDVLVEARSARFRNDFSALDISERAASKPLADVAAPLDRASK